MTGPWRVAAASLLLALPACLTSTQATRLQRDLDEVKRQLFEMQRETAQSRSSVEEIVRELSAKDDPLEREADMGATLRSLLDQVAILSERIEEMKGRITAMSQEMRELKQAGRETGTRETAGPRIGQEPDLSQAMAGADQVYQTAYSDYSKGNYELAQMGFTEFIRDNPDHPLASEAQYWVGECLYSQGRLAEAIEAFHHSLNRYPDGERSVTAMLRKGFAQLESGQTSQGVATLQRLMEAHPTANEAKLAADRLKDLGLRVR